MRKLRFRNIKSINYDNTASPGQNQVCQSNFLLPDKASVLCGGNSLINSRVVKFIAHSTFEFLSVRPRPRQGRVEVGGRYRDMAYGLLGGNHEHKATKPDI